MLAIQVNVSAREMAPMDRRRPNVVLIHDRFGWRNPPIPMPPPRRWIAIRCAFLALAALATVYWLVGVVLITAWILSL
jgi:hypothetical protein